MTALLEWIARERVDVTRAWLYDWPLCALTAGCWLVHDSPPLNHTPERRTDG